MQKLESLWRGGRVGEVGYGLGEGWDLRKYRRFLRGGRGKVDKNREERA